MDAKFRSNSRIFKKYTTNWRNRASTHAEGRLMLWNLFDFYKKSDKLFHGVERWIIFEVLFHFRAGANNCSIKHNARHIRPPGIASRCVQAQPEGLHTLDAACWKVFLHEKANIVEKRSHADGFLHKNGLFLEKLIILNSTTFDLW